MISGVNAMGMRRRHREFAQCTQSQGAERRIRSSVGGVTASRLMG